MNKFGWLKLMAVKSAAGQLSQRTFEISLWAECTHTKFPNALKSLLKEI
jgi:hypothetical protein